MSKNKKKVKKTITTIVEEEVIGTDYTEVIAVLDRSYSMINIIDEAIGGYNEFIKEQKKLDGRCNLTTVLFDDKYELLYDNVDINNTKKISREEWSPRGMTALNDAIGKSVNDVETRIKGMKKKDRPDKVLVVIVTDGEENCSREFRNTNLIKDLIKRKEKDDWQFVYLGANQDAFSVGTNLGFSGGNTLTFNTTVGGSTAMFDTLTKAVSNYRTTSMDSANYSTFSANIMNSVDDSQDDDEK